jgi:hypothetical protein
MAMIQMNHIDVKIFSLFSWLATPQEGEDVNDYLMEFCSCQIAHDNVEVEVNEILNHESFKFLDNMYQIKFGIELKNWLNDTIEMFKGT